MRWGDKNQVRRRLNCLRRAQAVGIDGNGIDPHIIHRQHVTDPPVGGLLDPRQIATIAEHTRHQIDCLMDPFRNKNLICLAVNASGHAQVIH